MTLVNTSFITGKNIETISFVSGSRFVLTMVDSKAIERAIADMVEQAKDMGADGIINVRYSPATNHAYVAGTAVRFV